MSTNAFQHEPLDYREPSIRLVRVLWTRRSGLLNCTMTHSTISANYTCLSYVWGEDPGPEEYRTILVNGRSFAIRPNLYDFLEVARTKYPFTKFWIDALCIDQANNNERNHQVQQMGQIYSKAKLIISYLGEDKITERELRLRRQDINGLPPKMLERCLKVVRASRGYKLDDRWYFERTIANYWSRAWITQELALASRVKLLAGKTEIDLMRKKLRNDYYDSFVQEAALLAEERHKLRGSRILELLDRFPEKQCSERRDRIYSLLALSVEHSNIKVDYNMSENRLLCLVLNASQVSCLCAVNILKPALYGSPFYDDSYLDFSELFRNNDPDLGKICCELRIAGHESHTPQHHVNSRCDDCQDTFKTPRATERGIVFCLRSFCRESTGHLFWSQQRIPRGSTSERVDSKLHFIPSGTLGPYDLGSLEELAENLKGLDRSTYRLRLTLRSVLRMTRPRYENPLPIPQLCRKASRDPRPECRFCFTDDLE